MPACFSYMRKSGLTWAFTLLSKVLVLVVVLGVEYMQKPLKFSEYVE
jgi:hypothetical protein